MDRKYNKHDIVVCTNGNQRENGTYNFIGEILGYYGNGYIVTYEQGWSLSQDYTSKESEIDKKHLGTPVWSVNDKDIKGHLNDCTNEKGI